MSTTTSQSRIASISFPSASESQGTLNGRFSANTLDLLVRSRRKRTIRSQNSILAAILEACRTPNVQHWIMVKARLGYDTFWHHMNELLSEGMMETVYDGNKTLYKINAKGINLLEELELA